MSLFDFILSVLGYINLVCSFAVAFLCPWILKKIIDNRDRRHETKG